MSIEPTVEALIARLALDRIARAREYVDDPGNWSALDGRRQVLLDLLDGKGAQGDGS